MLITLIKDDITFTNIHIPKAINTHTTELQLIKIHIGTFHQETRRHHTTTPWTQDITYCMRYVTNIPDSILTGDVNAHSTLWYSHTAVHRGQLIFDIISNSEHITLNTDTPTRVPHTTLQQATSPDITPISTTLYNRTTWHTIHALNFNHLPIITTINTHQIQTITKQAHIHKL